MMCCEAHKCTIRGYLIAISIKRKREKQCHINKLITHIHTLERAHKSTQAATSLHELVQTRKDLLNKLDKKSQRNYILNQKHFSYEHGKKVGKLLANALRTKRSYNTIHSLKDSMGCKIVTNEDIVNKFVTYYTHLYNLAPLHTQSRNTVRKQMINDFLATYTPKRFYDQEASVLDHPISPEEVHTALKQLKPGKSPGPDGLTSDYNKSFQEILWPYFLKAFNSISPDHPPPRDLLTAHITVIPKPNKDPSLVSNYQPISLLHVDLKL